MMAATGQGLGHQPAYLLVVLYEQHGRHCHSRVRGRGHTGSALDKTLMFT
jgi:hypothetical protein